MIRLGMRAAIPSISHVSREQSCHWAFSANDDRLCESIAPSSCQRGTKSHLCERPLVTKYKELRVKKACFCCLLIAHQHFLSPAAIAKHDSSRSDKNSTTVPAANSHCVGTDTKNGASRMGQ